MISIIRIYILPIAFFMVSTVQLSAQIKRSTKAKTTVSKTNKKTISKGRVSSSKIIYKTPKKKVVSVRNVPNRTVVRHNGQNYYYSNNKYYTQSRGRYIVIAPKVGFRINVLPTNYKRVRFNNHDYYNVSGIFYTQVGDEYEVIEPEIGTIVYELPDDYEKVVLDGETYYEYANVLYEKIQYDGTRAYEVVGIIDMN
ncbi:DUF6515 family protein [Nonlabens sp.]|uniref:DUF6515 family protein n=1 Tax=Nonlabens sp. TaxID=1888209 RepID=UPI0032651262